jgi:hypothetical protein
MKRYFDVIGDKVPNHADEVHIEACKIKEIYQEYTDNMAEVTSCDYGVSNTLGYSAFLKLWGKCFQHVKIREHKAVAGKCRTCALLTATRRQRKDEYGKCLCTELHALHRSMYSGKHDVYMCTRMCTCIFIR